MGYDAGVERRAFKQAMFAVRDDEAALDIVQDAMLRLAERYVAFLHRIADDPHASLASFDVTTAAERHRLLVEFNQTPAEYDPARTALGLFEERARERAGEPAVLCGGRQLTYGQLDARANQWARALRARGVGPEVLVGLCAESSPEAIAG